MEDRFATKMKMMDAKQVNLACVLQADIVLQGHITALGAALVKQEGIVKRVQKLRRATGYALGDTFVIQAQHLQRVMDPVLLVFIAQLVPTLRPCLFVPPGLFAWKVQMHQQVALLASTVPKGRSIFMAKALALMGMTVKREGHPLRTEMVVFKSWQKLLILSTTRRLNQFHMTAPVQNYSSS